MSDNTKEKFKSILKSLRTEKQLSQRDFADKIGVSHSIISDWENGVSEPTLSKLIALADFFDVTIDYLAGRKDY